MNPDIQHFAPLLLIAALMAFGIYRRVRQHIGRQRLRPTRFKVRIALLCVVAVVIMASAPAASLIAGLAGAGAGVGLALLSLHLTRIEQTAEGTFYRGNIYIGLGLIALLVGRIGWRMMSAADAIQTAMAHAGTARPPGALTTSMSSPLTAAIFLVMVGYYIAYYTGLILKARKAGSAS